MTTCSELMDRHNESVRLLTSETELDSNDWDYDEYDFFPSVWARIMTGTSENVGVDEVEVSTLTDSEEYTGSESYDERSIFTADSECTHVTTPEPADCTPSVIEEHFPGLDDVPESCWGYSRLFRAGFFWQPHRITRRIDTWLHKIQSGLRMTRHKWLR
ncbi:hypothetical protein ABKN59_000253 [Abortiporus biennis]